MARTNPTVPGPGTTSVFGRQIRFDLAKSFPLITTKRVHFKSVAVELLWFLRGESNVKWMQDQGVTIWNEWADADGELGPVYGVQWRSWPTPDGGHIDQIAELVENLKSNPDSRRHIVSAWNVSGAQGHGAAAVPRVLPVLRGGRQAVLPAVPALRGHVPGRSVQHCLLRAADPHGGAAGGAGRLASSSGPAATSTSTRTTWTRSSSSWSASPTSTRS